ncbi:MAG: tetratricopeptide repeat protein [Candidatus Brocadiaceae bacterium]|nr:tetratricopeptide repeat protein [Candidatus Brocadiaceae bacterium]
MKNNYIFISHGNKYDELVKNLCKDMENHGLEFLANQHEATSGDELPSDIKQKIEQACTFITVIGPDTIDSPQVLKETKYAIEIKGKEEDGYKVIPLILAGVKPNDLDKYFEKKSFATNIQIGSGGISESVSKILDVMGKRLSDKREDALFAGIEYSLHQLSSEIREKVKPLGVFQEGGSISNVANVLQLNDEDRDLIVKQLVDMNLAKPMSYGFLRFHPALCPYLHKELDDTALNKCKARWSECLRQLSEFLYKQQSEDSELADSLTLLELPNLMKSLEYVQSQSVPEVTLDRVTLIEQLIAHLDKPEILAKVKGIREEEEKKSTEWGPERFETLSIQVEKLLEIGNLPQALSVAQVLLDKCLKADEGSYEGSDYDTAMAYILLGRVLRLGGAAENALQSINEAHKRFQQLSEKEGSDAAGKMASATLAKKGECLLELGRLDESAAAYEESIQVAEALKSDKHIAVSKGQLGTVRMSQGRHEEAINAHNEAREIFEGLGDLNMVAVAYQQMGAVHEEIAQFEEAEQAYKQSLAITVGQKNPLDEAKNLGRLGSFYAKVGRSEEAVDFLRQSAEKYVETKETANEGRVRGNLTITLITLKRYDEARKEIQRAIECFKPYGYDVEPWRAWDKLHVIEMADNNQEAADQARNQAIQLYLAFRRNGGEDHNPGGRLCTLFRDAMEKQPPEEVKKNLDEVANDPKIPAQGKLLVSKLQTILTGSREVELASDPDLDYIDAAEILFLFENLERQEAKES